jgi:hypothetical protein
LGPVTWRGEAESKRPLARGRTNLEGHEMRLHAINKKPFCYVSMRVCHTCDVAAAAAVRHPSPARAHKLLPCLEALCWRDVGGVDVH